MSFLRSTASFAMAALAGLFGRGDALPADIELVQSPMPRPEPAAPKQKAFTHHQPARAGTRRAELRLAKKLRWNHDNIPDLDTMTRQQRRAAERRAAKARRVTPAEAARRAMAARRRSAVLARQVREAQEGQA